MIRVTYAQLNQGSLMAVLDKLQHVPGFKPQTAWKIMKMNRKLTQELKHAREFFGKMIRDHAELDEQGNPKVGEDKKYVLKPEMKDSFEKKAEEFLKMEIELRENKILFSDLNDAGLSPYEYEILEPLMEVPAEDSAPLENPAAGNTEKTA
jgi:hypothetical protein